MINYEIVMTVGYPGCGKTTIVQKQYPNYFRINRDALGRRAKMAKVHELLEVALIEGKKQIVLDNTYATRESRKPVLELAKKYNMPVTCLFIDAKIEHAQFLACRRMIQQCGKILSPNEIKRKKDSNLFPPIAQYGYRKRFEKPELSEGFNRLEIREFKLDLGPEYKNEAIIFDYDGTLRETISDRKYPISPDDIRIPSGRKAIVKGYKLGGMLVLGVSNQSGVAKGLLRDCDAKACFEKTNELLGVDIEYVYCPHRAAPLSCFCRKPMPGWGVHFIEKYKLDPSKVTFVGDMTTDKTFAKRCGFKFVHAFNFFEG